MFLKFILPALTPILQLSLAILAVAAALIGVYVLRKGVFVVIATLRGRHVFGGRVWSESEWEQGMKAVHYAKRRGEFVDADSLNAYKKYMRSNIR